MAGAVDKRDVPREAVRAPGFAQRGVLAAARPREEAEGRGALGLLALVDLAVGVAQLDGDVALELRLVPLRLRTRQRLPMARGGWVQVDAGGCVQARGSVEACRGVGRVDAGGSSLRERSWA